MEIRDTNFKYSDLNNLQKELNNQIIRKEYPQFLQSLKSYLGKDLLVNGQRKRITIWVKPIRKKFLQICSGKKCFFKGFYNPKNQEVKLNKISCCNFHTYCQDCLHDYIIDRLSLNRDVKVGCEGCCEMGFATPDKVLEVSEMKNYVSESEFNEAINTGLKRQYISKCVAGYEHCQFKNSPMLKDQFRSFDCCGNICLNCYGTAVEKQLRDSIKIIETSPKYLHGKQLTLKCIKEHGLSSFFPRYDEIQKIIKHSVSPEDNKVSLMNKVRDYIHLFQRGIIIFCTFCEKLFVSRDPIKCDMCGKCFKCGKEYHQSINCATYSEYSESSAEKGDILQAIKDNNDPNFQQYIKAAEILTNMGLSTLKIDNFYIVTPSKMNVYKSGLLSQENSDLQHKYLFSKPYDSMDSIENDLNEGIKKHQDGYYRLHEHTENQIKTWIQNGIENNEERKSKENSVIFIVYKVIYSENNKERHINRDYYYHQYERKNLKLIKEETVFKFSYEYAAKPSFILYLNNTVQE